MKPIFSIDPGNVKSAYVIYHRDTHTLGDFGKVDNDELRSILKKSLAWEYEYSIEMIASYGMAVGKSVFDTCAWIGRYTEIITSSGAPVELVFRGDVKMYLCGVMKANDSNIRQAIIDCFPASGGGRTPAIGTKPLPGPLYGVKADVWAALGVALTHDASKKLEEGVA